MPKIFSSFLFGLNVISKKKKKKKKVITPMEAFFLQFYVVLQKKKVLRLSSATFLRDFCDIPERGAVNHGCPRFLAGNKNAGFWREKKRRNSQNFSAKMPKKISHFFALIGNTGWGIDSCRTRLANIALESYFSTQFFFSPKSYD